jgi:CheY-like chemotaxis protein
MFERVESSRRRPYRIAAQACEKIAHRITRIKGKASHSLCLDVGSIGLTKIRAEMPLNLLKFSQAGGSKMNPQANDNGQAAVLLLDDNAVQAAVRQTVLRRSGYFAIAALNAKRALEQFQNGEFPARISAVITDHIMPGMTGAEFVRELRKTHPTLPVMVISGLEEAQVEYADMNVDFQLKPLPPETLLSHLRDLLAEENEGAA